MWGNYKKYFGWGFICETWYYTVFYIYLGEEYVLRGR